jgi:hypothetical protein
MPKETKIDSITKELAGAWVNIEYLKYLEKYGTAHQALKKINTILALSIDSKERKGNRFSVNYILTKQGGGETPLAYFDLDSMLNERGYPLTEDWPIKEERFLKWKNDTIQILIKRSKGFQKTVFKRVLIQDAKSYVSSYEGPAIANRKLLSNLSFDLFSAEGNKMSRNVTFNSKGEVENWEPYETFSLGAYHATKYLDHDQLRLWSDKDNKVMNFYVEKKGNEWMLYEQGSVQFVREEVPLKGKLLFILKENSLNQ